MALENGIDRVKHSVDQSALLDSHGEKHSDTVNGALQSQWDLLRDGLAQGFNSRAQEASNNTLLTSGEVGGSFAIGAGLSLAMKAGGRWATAAKAGAVLFSGLMAFDLSRRGNSLYEAYSKFDGNSSYDREMRKNSVATNLGAGLFDYSLSMASGGLGFASTRLRVGAAAVSPTIAASSLETSVRLPANTAAGSQRALPEFAAGMHSEAAPNLIPNATQKIYSDAALRSIPDSAVRAVPDFALRFGPESPARSLSDLALRSASDSVVRNAIRTRNLPDFSTPESDAIAVISNDAPSYDTGGRGAFNEGLTRNLISSSDLPDPYVHASKTVVDIWGPNSMGNGFFASPEGLVVTDNHVVAGSESWSMRTSDGRTVQAKVISRDPANDLAILAMQDRGSKKPDFMQEFGAAEPYDDVAAVSRTKSDGASIQVSTGEIADITTLNRLTDLALPGENIQRSILLGTYPSYPGMSGAPVVRLMDGKVIGVVNGNVKRLSNGFATPAEAVSNLLGQARLQMPR